MAPLACQLDLPVIHRSHDRTRSEIDLAEFQPRHVVHAVNLLDTPAIHHAIGAHLATTAATLFGSGIFNGDHLAIVAPALFLMGSQVQYVGRLLGVVGTRAQHIPVMIGISVLNAFGAMLVMRVLI